MRAGLVADTLFLGEAFAQLEESSRATALATLRRGDFTLASARYALSPEDGEGHWELIRLAQDLFVIIVNADYKQGAEIDVIGEDLIEFHFRLSGSFRILEQDNAFDIGKGQLLIWRQPEGAETREQLFGDSERESSVTIYCRPSFLERSFGASYGEIKHELAELLAPACNEIRSLHAALYPRLARLVIDLAAVADRSGLKLVQAEALVLQIVAELLENIELQRQAQAIDIRISDRDAQCLRKARDLLLREHTPPPTVEAIARQVGLSRTKLKASFRTMFGQTIADFGNDLRMNRARDMLSQSDKPIAHISAELGYEYQTSFTNAFRRRFGILPKDYRRDPLAYPAS